jgi:hypothetical protein
MKAKYIVDTNEIKRILEMHDKHNPKKRVILEQTDAIQQQLQNLVDTGCFPRKAEVVKINGGNTPETSWAVKMGGQINPNAFRYFYLDKEHSVYTFDSNNKPVRVKDSKGVNWAKWRCVNDSKISDFKKTGQGGGWMTYQEANTPNADGVKPIDLNPDGEGITWEQTTFEGRKFYRAKRGENSSCPKYDELVSKRQKDFVDKIKSADVQNATWLLCGDLENATNQYEYVPYKIPNSENVFPGGLTMYRPKSGMTKDAGATQVKARERIKAKTYNRKECKNIIQTYWDDFKQSEFDTPNFEDKINAQSCVRQYYDNWGGLFSGEKNYDKIIDVLTCVSTEYEGQRQPSASQPCIDKNTKKTNPNTWRLCPKNYYS